jgi:hypothetical protein
MAYLEALCFCCLWGSAELGTETNERLEQLGNVTVWELQPAARPPDHSDSNTWCGQCWQKS